MSVEIHAGIRTCGQMFGFSQVREAVQVSHFFVKWDRFFLPFHTFTLDHDSDQVTKNCWLSGWAGCCIHPSPLGSQIHILDKGVTGNKIFFILLLSYFSCHTTKLAHFAPGLVKCEDTLKKGEIGLLTEFHGTADYCVTKSKQWCCKFCTFIKISIPNYIICASL